MVRESCRSHIPEIICRGLSFYSQFLNKENYFKSISLERIPVK